MIKRIVYVSLIGIVAVLFVKLDLWSTSATKKGMPIQSRIASGVYVHTNILRISDIRNLPIPKTNVDYAFIQSLDTICNVVVGKFTTGHKEIIIYKDKNVDGKVDIIAHWYVDRKKFKFEPDPNKFCPPEEFKKMKEQILQGTTGKLNPNEEGIQYLNVLFQDSGNIRRWYNGYLVTGLDPDDESSQRVVYFFSDNQVRGVDISFIVKYVNRGLVRESPIIKYAVYCKDTKDKYLIDTVKKLMKEAKKFGPQFD
ncbi:MAG: hypothetical protein GY754_04660 [bacterium]|nr:hypothetical protein [bacterium]